MKVLSIIRCAVMFVLFTACLLLVHCDVNEGCSMWQFAKAMLISKALGFLSGYLLYRCFKAWENTDYYLSRLVKWCDKEDC